MKSSNGTSRRTNKKTKAVHGKTKTTEQLTKTNVSTQESSTKRCSHSQVVHKGKFNSEYAFILITLEKLKYLV